MTALCVAWVHAAMIPGGLVQPRLPQSHATIVATAGERRGPQHRPGVLHSVLRMRAGDAKPAPQSDMRPTVMSVPTVLIAAFLNLLGFTMMLPMNVALRSHFGLTTGASFGSLSSAYPLGMFFALFLWPRLSDRVGRRPVISMSLAGSGLGLLAQCYALYRSWPLHYFLGCRVLTGCCAGAGPVAKAYLADLGSATGRLPRYMAWRDAANTMAFIAGPLIGGQLYQLTGSLAAVIGFTAASSLAAAATVSVFVREDLVPNTAAVAPAPSAVAAAPPRKPSKVPEEELLACPLGRELATAIATVCVVSSLYNCGTATFSAFFGPLVKDLTGVGVRGIGLSYTLLSSLSFLVSISIAAPAQMALGTLRTCILGLASVACGLLGMGAVVASSATIGTAQLAAFWLAAAVYQVGVPLFAPTVPTMLLQCVPRHRRGAIMGLDEAFNTVARVAAPIAFGQLYSTQGPTTCLSAASLAVFLAAVVAVIRGLLVMRSTRGD